MSSHFKEHTHIATIWMVLRLEMTPARASQMSPRHTFHPGFSANRKIRDFFNIPRTSKSAFSVMTYNKHTLEVFKKNLNSCTGYIL